MKKKILIISIVLVNIFVGLSFSINKVYGWKVTFSKFQVDKDIYYFDEEIIVDINFDLYFDEDEYGRLSLQIFNASQEVWEGEYYWGFEGHNHHSATLHIDPQEFDHPFNDTNHFMLQWCYCLYKLINGHWVTYIDHLHQPKLEIDVIKHNATCELFNFSNICYGEQLFFNARFFDNNTDTPYQDKIYCENSNLSKVLFNSDYIANQTGEIEVLIKADNYSLGLNQIVFELLGNDNFSNNTFEYSFNVSEQIIPPPNDYPPTEPPNNDEDEGDDEGREDKPESENNLDIIMLAHISLPFITIASVFIIWSLIIFYFIKHYKKKHFKF
ncbi:MAG: hypothetical protein EU539_08090 [Promethearchaeota archaeon]|nr:MAG: hypothetical protein EU539_08090 [Candidatus Lokiarchaeota archaeon]